MKILLFFMYYNPDGGPAAPLSTSLSECLVDHGNDVTVISAVPHFPTGYVSDEYKGFSFRYDIENGVKVIRVPLPSVNRINFVFRMIQFLVYQIFAFVIGFKVKADVVMAHSPAFCTGFPFTVHGLLHRGRKTVYSINDIYPDVGIKMGIFQSSFVVKVIETLEKYIIKHSNKIHVVSKSLIDRVEELGADRKDIKVIYNWVETDLIKPTPKINPFSIRYEIEKSYNVVYAGNIGYLQGLDTVIHTAELLKEKDYIRFIFIGEGNAKNDLMAKADSNFLTNVIFVSYQPKEIMSQIYGAADIGLVSLKKGVGFDALPSKMYSILASATPVVACVDPGSDAWDIIQKSGGGIAIPPENPQKLADSILKIYNQPDRGSSMGVHGRNYVAEYHSPECAAKNFFELFK